MAGCHANRAAHSGVEAALQQAGWNRRHDFAGSPLCRAPTVAVSRAFQDSFAKHSGRMRHQCSTVDGLLVRCFPGCDTHIGLRANWRKGRVTDFANSIRSGRRTRRSAYARSTRKRRPSQLRRLSGRRSSTAAASCQPTRSTNGRSSMRRTNNRSLSR
jgi:hypothetical protein